MAFTYAGAYCENVPYVTGGEAINTPVTIKIHGSGTLATTYTDRTKGSTSTNPINTDVNGNLTFYADPGLYDCTTTSGGAFLAVLPSDPLEPGSGQGLPLGLTGATAATRYAGGTASVAPSTGTFQTGDYVVTQTGLIFVCTAGGSPGTWVNDGSTRLSAASNLSDLSNVGTARTNLGLGSAALISSTAGGDLAGTLPSPTVRGINGTTLSGLATGLLKITTGTGAATIAVPGTDYDAAGAATAVLGQPMGLTGATQATRYVGGTASVAPASGSFITGDYIVTQTGLIFVCTASGSPGTWVNDGSTRLLAASNLSDLANAGTARTNLGLGAIATLTATGATDVSGTWPNLTVTRINGTAPASLSTGIIKNTTGTGVFSIAAAADIPVVAAGVTGPLSATDGSVTNSRTPSGSTGGDLSGTYPSTITVIKIQGVAVTSANATLLAQSNGAITRSASATVVAGEETVFTGSTAAQTLTLPATPQVSSENTITNTSSVSFTVAAGAGNTINNNGTVGSVTVPVGGIVKMIFIGTVWYVEYYWTNTITGTGSAVQSISPALTGTPTVPTQAANDNSTKISSTAYADANKGLSKALTGATGATRYVGGTVSGAPASGTFAVGDYAIDQTGGLWICTSAGTPGTWVTPAGSPSSALPLDDVVGGAIGTSTSFARADHQHSRNWEMPGDLGALAWTITPEYGTIASAAMVSGTVYAFQVPLGDTATVGHVYTAIQTAGSGLTSGQSRVGLYNPAGTLIGDSHVNSSGTELSTAFASTGGVTITLTATGTGLTNLAPGMYRIAVFQVGTTPAVFKGGNNSTSVNSVLASANVKYGSADTGRTTSFPGTLGSTTGYGSSVTFGITT